MSGQHPATSRLFGLNQLLLAVIYKWYATAIVVVLIMLGVEQTSYLLILLLAIYNGTFGFITLKRPFNLDRKPLILGVDLIVCTFLLFISGGWASPYFQYSLSFLILAALFYSFRGAALSFILYGALYFIALYVNGFDLNKIIAKGYLVSFITDYIIFATIGFFSAAFFKIFSSLASRAHVSKERVSGEKPSIESLFTSLSFTPQQVQVARLMVDGLDNDQIASELGISVNTVKYHLKNIYQKLDVDCRLKAIQKLTGTRKLPNLPMPTHKDKTPG